MRDSTFREAHVRLAAASALAFAIASLGSSAAAQVPVVERLEPTSGPVGSQVVMVGRGFPADMRIELGGTPLQVTERLPNRVTFVIAPGARSGRLSLHLGRIVALGPQFVVTEAAQAPQIDSFTPISGPPGTEVVLSGRDFSPRTSENVVTLGGVRVPLRSASPFSLRVIIPVGAPSGPFVVSVAGREGRSAGSFAVSVGVTITDFQPRAGGPGSRVTLSGSGFSPRTAANRVSLNGSLIRVESASETQLVVVIPAGATSGPFVVDVRGAGQAQSTIPFQVTAAAPVVASIAPDRGLPGQRVRIVGASFGTDPAAVRVALGPVQVPVRAVSPRLLVVEIPQGAASGPFTVTVAGVAAASPVFTVLQGLAIADFQPRTGGPGTEVRISGTGFDPTPTRNLVTIGRVPQLVLAASPQELRVRISGTQSGPIRVSVPGSGTTVSSFPFVLTTPPVLARFEPLAALPGAEVTLHGSGFGERVSLVTITLAGRPVPIRSLQNDRIVVSLPAGATSGRFRVTVQLQGTVESGSDFVVLQQTTITSVSPTQAPVGAVLTLTGTGFDPDPRRLTVTFTGGRAVRPTASSPQQLQVTVPRGAQSGPITVTVADGRTATSGYFDVLVPPRILSVAPGAGPIGTRVTITGTGFAARTARGAVRIGAIEMPVESLSETQIVVTVPPAATSGRITVTIGDLRPALGPLFRVTAPPPPPPEPLTVTALVPQCMRGGCRVTFRGTGFSARLADNRVRFGHLPCRVVAVTLTELAIELPQAPGTAQFRVDVRGRGSFVVPPPFTITP